jgi:hypothetical protein
MRGWEEEVELSKCNISGSSVLSAAWCVVRVASNVKRQALDVNRRLTPDV